MITWCLSSDMNSWVSPDHSGCINRCSSSFGRKSCNNNCEFVILTVRALTPYHCSRISKVFSQEHGEIYWEIARRRNVMMLLWGHVRQCLKFCKVQVKLGVRLQTFLISTLSQVCGRDVFLVLPSKHQHGLLMPVETCHLANCTIFVCALTNLSVLQVWK
jgi:hypothetical protein